MGIASVNPATGEVIKTFQPLSEAEIEKKIQLAVKIFTAERKTPFAVRAQRMLKAAEIIERDKEKFGAPDDARNGQDLQVRSRGSAQVYDRLPILCREYREVYGGRSGRDWRQKEFHPLPADWARSSP